MWHFLLYFYGYFIFFYSLGLIATYLFLLVSAYKYATNYNRWTKSYIRNMVDNSPFTPGVSIVAPAYNEEVTVVDNVNSLLQMDYPKFEIIIVNDGSKDKTLEKLIENFDLIEVPYDYIYRVHCKPFKRLFKSTNLKYQQLIVVDKENGGTKADAVNGGLNVAQYPYFINTDVDCILAHDAMYECIFPVLMNNDIIAVSGTMSMSNGFELKNGEISNYRPSSNIFALFQDLEYKRSFLVGKMGWSKINAMNNVSGGYGLFDTQVVIAAGGYGYDSFAEDMDMLTRMEAYCCDFGRDYRVVQIPHTCCWTEGPSSLSILSRQRVRWGRGLIQLMFKHKKYLFNKKYKKLGLISMPYTFLFEFLAPIIEFVGLLMIIYLAFTGGINWNTFWIMFFAIYLFSVMISQFIIFYDFINGGSYSKTSSYWKLFIAGICEPFVYHPLIVFFSLRGYFNYLIGTRASWGAMTRKGVKQQGETKTAGGNPGADSAETNPQSGTQTA